MHPAHQLIEELQIHNLPHNADGSFNITAKQRDAIELLLLRQAVVAQSDEASAISIALNYFDSDEQIASYQSLREDILLLCNRIRSQQAVVEQTDHPLWDEYSDSLDSKVEVMYRHRFTEALQQLFKEINILKQWKAEALAVMPDMQAIGKAIGVPLGQSIHDKILPAIQRLMKQQGMRWVKCSERSPTENRMYVTKIIVKDDGLTFLPVAYNQYDTIQNKWTNPNCCGTSGEVIEWLDESAERTQQHP